MGGMMVIDVILAGVIGFLFYVVNQLCLYVIKLDRRLREHGIHD